MGKLYGNKNVFKGICTSDILFCWFLILNHNQKYCLLCAIYGNANKKEVINQIL